MSLKTRRHAQHAKQEHMSGNHNSVLNMLNNNKFLIGGVVAASGAAVFLFGTQSGKRVRAEIQTRAVDVYNSVSSQVSSGLDQVRDFANNCLTHHESDELAA